MINQRKKISSYLAEIIVIIVGITVSFFLNDWKESNNLKDQKSQLILDIQEDLRADSVYFSRLLYSYQLMGKSHDSLLAGRLDSFNRDSLTLFYDHVTTYLTFNRRTRSYNILSNNDDLKIQPKDTSLRMFMNLHNYVYRTLDEWLFMEKEFIFKEVNPYLNENSPFIVHDPENNSYSGDAFYELRKKDQFLNYLQTGKFYKEMITEVLVEGSMYLNKTKKSINQEVSAQLSN
jgi:hypothetical protein